MGATNPGNRCCSNTATLFGGVYLCGTCSTNSTACASDAACTDRCCSKTFVSDAASQRYCTCE